MRRWLLGTGVWILSGILLVTISLILSIREEDQSFPSITNVRASGYAAFAELLRRDGYIVAIDRHVRPRLAPSDVVFATSFDSFIPSEFEEYGPLDSTEETPVEPYLQVIKAHLAKGGNAIEVLNRRNFKLASSLAERPRNAESARDSDLRVPLTVPYGSSAWTSVELDHETYDAWFMDDEPFVSYMAHEGGLLVTVADGLPITNRYLDEGQNAEFFLNVVRSVADPGSKIVFVEAGIGNAESPSVVNTLGQWAVAARWQAVFLFVVVVLTLGIRFGLPVVERRTVRGSRELFDAVADVLRRTRNTGLSLDSLLMECDQRIRSVTKAGAQSARHEFLALVPKELKDQYLKVAEMSALGPHPDEATKEAMKLLSLLESFERDSRAARGLRR